MIICLTGKMGCGKSTTASLLSKELNWPVYSIGDYIKPLANLLINDFELFRTSLKSVLPNTKEADSALSQLFDYREKHIKDVEWEIDDSGLYVKNEPYRKLLQEFPMLIRESFGTDIFAKVMLKHIKDNHVKDMNYICDDIRLLSEKMLLDHEGAIQIRLEISKEEQMNRLLKTYGAVKESALTHVTETDLDSEVFDLVIYVDNKTPSEIVSKIKYYLN